MPALPLVPLGFTSHYTKHPWKAPPCTHARLLGPPVWRNQGEYNPPQHKIVGTTVSAFAPPAHPQVSVCPHKGAALLATAPRAQEHRDDGAGGLRWGPQAEQPTKAAAGAHQQPCAAALPKDSISGTVDPQPERILRDDIRLIL